MGAPAAGVRRLQIPSIDHFRTIFMFSTSPQLTAHAIVECSRLGVCRQNRDGKRGEASTLSAPVGSLAAMPRICCESEATNTKLAELSASRIARRQPRSDSGYPHSSRRLRRTSAETWSACAANHVSTMTRAIAGTSLINARRIVVMSRGYRIQRPVRVSLSR